ncbi:hypothetical protein [Nocardia wallacei]|uniref:16S rRNA (adenine(1408)-N(1))-methyltransferase WarA n=1 Tax=Nocardia wallacei TaxID=480035 RepID=UPI003CC7F702
MARCRAVRIDLGTGDGRAVLAAAAADPDLLVIGIDAHAAGMAESSRKAARARQGLPNAVFVAAAAEKPPPELDGVADELTVLFPWGSLLRGLLTADPAVLDGVARLMKSGAALDILLSVVERDGLPGLPAISGPETLSALADSYAAHGLSVTAIRPVTPDEVAAVGSSWGKRLGAGTRRPVWRITARHTGVQEPTG